jgi:hypothetical protein
MSLNVEIVNNSLKFSTENFTFSTENVIDELLEGSIYETKEKMSQKYKELANACSKPCVDCSNLCSEICNYQFKFFKKHFDSKDLDKCIKFFKKSFDSKDLDDCVKCLSELYSSRIKQACIDAIKDSIDCPSLASDDGTLHYGKECYKICAKLCIEQYPKACFDACYAVCAISCGKVYVKLYSESQSKHCIKECYEHIDKFYVKLYSESQSKHEFYISNIQDYYDKVLKNYCNIGFCDEDWRKTYIENCEEVCFKTCKYACKKACSEINEKNTKESLKEKKLIFMSGNSIIKKNIWGTGFGDKIGQSVTKNCDVNIKVLQGNVTFTVYKYCDYIINTTFTIESYLCKDAFERAAELIKTVNL